MITSKQRAQLRAMANPIETILQIGKGGISAPTLIKQVDDALTARELIKMRVLENSGYTAKEAAVELAQALNAEVVQAIGTRFVLYRKNQKEPKIQLVK